MLCEGERCCERKNISNYFLSSRHSNHLHFFLFLMRILESCDVFVNLKDWLEFVRKCIFNNRKSLYPRYIEEKKTVLTYIKCFM